MLKDTIQSAINDQINLELSSAYVYLSMAAYLESANLPGSARWMRAQWQEELAHAMRLFDFVVERGGRVSLAAIAQPHADYGSLLDVFRQALGHEQHVTASIHALYELAGREKDYPTQVMLQWFIDEQVEEEAAAEGVVAQLELIGDHGPALFGLDQQLGRRGAE